MKKLICVILSCILVMGMIILPTDINMAIPSSAELKIQKYDIFDIRNARDIPSSDVDNKYNITVDTSALLGMEWKAVPNAFYYEIGVYQPSHTDNWGNCDNISTVADKAAYYWAEGKAISDDINKFDFLNQDVEMLYIWNSGIGTATFFTADKSQIDSPVVFWVTAYDKSRNIIGQSRYEIKDFEQFVREQITGETSKTTNKTTEKTTTDKVTTKKKSNKLDAPENIKVSKTASKIKLKWDEVEGADAYRVYQYDARTKKYKSYKIVTGEQCTVTNLKAGTTYKFKIVALKKTNGKYKTAGDYTGAIKIKTKSK